MLPSQIRMPRPDTEGRYDILRLQLASKKVSPDIDLLQLARDLPGLVGADLANIVNEAQLNGEAGCVCMSGGLGFSSKHCCCHVMSSRPLAVWGVCQGTQGTPCSTLDLNVWLLVLLLCCSCACWTYPDHSQGHVCRSGQVHTGARGCSNLPAAGRPNRQSLLCSSAYNKHSVQLHWRDDASVGCNHNPVVHQA